MWPVSGVGQARVRCTSGVVRGGSQGYPTPDVMVRGGSGLLPSLPPPLMPA